ncbi:MAG: hypothetical protein ETSY1_18280 [Candidatus Entotheonella factor]|uniref:DUF697 domain-containing protein n=1 Tax=Entotheonella factor TaxID=1429438 RepID=W4LKR2_ENTF1|nr:YcjF family protein [Candidatus Entotheonella palauensis]ETW98577.1 MAG: hypothetical protein ETSY1_18280 [Candidatus Entotheonella factor]
MSNSPERITPIIDLVIAIDTSVSMRDEAVGLSAAAESAIEAARSNGPSDLQVTWLGVEGTWDNTHFDRTVRDYLMQECHVAESDIRGRKRGTVKGGGAQEDGARTIEDIASHFNWRSGAARAIFYLSDEGLEGGGDDVTEADIEAANRAIEAAISAKAMVHTYFGITLSRDKDKLRQEFARVAHDTGGQAFTHDDLANGFTQILKDIICSTQSKTADEAAIIDVEAISIESPDTDAESDANISAPPPETVEPEAATVDTGTDARNNTDQIVRNHALVAAGIGLIPLPLADLAAIGATQLLMIRKLSQCYDLPFSQHRATAFISALISAGETGLILTSVGKWVPGIGAIGLSVTTAAAAGGLTYAIGKVFVRHFDTGGTFLDLDANAMKAYFAEQYQAGKLTLK